MIVMQYEMKFSELSYHVVWLFPTDSERIRRFIDDLTFQLRVLMTKERVSGAIFNEVVNISREIESVRSQERVEREAKRGRPYKHAETAFAVHRGESSGHGSNSSQQGHLSLTALPIHSSSHAPST
uniref:Uncharacterized protein LOC104248541 n=1 Tax=Nicotiana sylvestris TaxID=4096 RepID=A0A1U7YG77_NICSY|nr:PREDICTED: uncharacterized protein LOC104248541 [Nicotiana sylvestris]